MVGGEREGMLVVRVRARAVEGAANRAVIEALAGALEVRPRDVTLESGLHSRQKLLRVLGEVGEIEERLARLRRPA
jgi:uncharacterized protein YggU (UPF0235/DUF167 family)